MKTERRNILKGIMQQAWMLVKKFGFSIAEALRQAWQIAKLRKLMKSGIVKFMYSKLDGSVRTAWGTLKEALLPASQGSGRKPNETVMVYFDSEKESYRSFKIANFIKVVK